MCEFIYLFIYLFYDCSPFVGNTVGRDNYKFFIGLLVTHAIAGTLWLITALIFRSRTKISWRLLLFMVYSCLWMFMIGSLLAYHVNLMIQNLTTNEHIGLAKYPYLMNQFHMYDNPFEKASKWDNIIDSIFPSEVAVYHRHDTALLDEKV